MARATATIRSREIIGPAIIGGPRITPIVLGATKAMEAKYKALGGAGALGNPVNKAATVWTFERCCICYNSKRKEAFLITGAIYAKWLALGGRRWGVPNTDELPTADGTGYFNHFNDDTKSIFWSPNTPACGVEGDIRKRWVETAFERGYLGYPTSDELDIDDGGRANFFQHGQIYFWPDTGAIDLRDVVVHYTGFYAVRESDRDQSSGSDEPYCILAVVAPPQSPYTFRTRVYSGVDDNSARPDSMEVYRGPAYGLTIGITAMEQDFGSPEAMRLKVQAAVDAHHEVGKFALQFIPLVGPLLSKTLGPALGALMPHVGKALSGLLNLGDDRVGSTVLSLRTKQLVLLASRTANAHFKGIGYKVESATMSGGGAYYRVYFEVIGA